MLKYSLKPPLSTLRDCKTTRLKFGIGSLNMFNLLYKEFKTNKQTVNSELGWVETFSEVEQRRIVILFFLIATYSFHSGSWNNRDVVEN